MDKLIDFYSECGRSDQNETFDDANEDVTVIELTRDGRTDKIEFSRRVLSGTAVASWLAESGSLEVSVNIPVILQLVQITLKPTSYSNHRHLDISKANYDAIKRAWQFTPIIKYGTSATQVLNESSAISKTSSTIHIDDYFTLLQRYDHLSGLTRAMYIASEKILPYLEKAMRHQLTLGHHPFFLHLCAAMSFNAVLDSRLSTVSDDMARIERRTGFKAWDLGRYKPAQGDSYALSATASGYATSLAANRRLNRLVETLLKMHHHGTPVEFDASVIRRIEYVSSGMSETVQLLKQRNDVQGILIDFLSARLQNQITALFNIITQTDTRITISLAKDSRMLASASKHDSSSMKALATVTVLFLPGTFVSSLFSISFFDWKSETDKSIVNNRFWIYWAVTLPLTFMTILTWLWWTKMEDARTKEKEAKSLDTPEEEDEASVSDQSSQRTVV